MLILLKMVGISNYYMGLAAEASDAEIAIDNHRLGKATEEQYQNVRNLSNSLYEIAKGYDPSTEFMMDDVIWPNRKDWVGKTRDDTRLQTWLFAKNLETFTYLSKERQRELLDACLRLSREARYSSKPMILRLSA